MTNTNNISNGASNFNVKTVRLCHKLLDDTFFDEDGRIKEELKFKIDIPQFNIQNSKISGKPEDKFETMLFLPEGEDRHGEGGLRTKGYFKHSYKLVNGEWYIVDWDNNPVIPAPEDIQSNIKQYLSSNAQYQTPITELPLITVITVVYNGAKYLEETIQSVINQTYPNVEYIIIDGGSTDGTLDIIKKYEDYIDYWISERDKGIYDAMNKGIMCACGSLIALLNSGDKYSTDACFEFVKYLNQDSNIDGIYGNSLVYSEKSKLLYKRLSEEASKLIKNMPVFHSEVFIRNSVYKVLGFYDTTYKVAADYEFLLRTFLHKYILKKIDKDILHYRLGGFSHKFFIRSQKEMIKIKKRYGLSVWFTYFEIIKFIIKNFFLIKYDSPILQFYRKIFHKKTKKVI